MTMGRHDHGWPTPCFQPGHGAAGTAGAGLGRGHVYRSAWRAVRHGSANMDTLIAGAPLSHRHRRHGILLAGGELCRSGGDDHGPTILQAATSRPRPGAGRLRPLKSCWSWELRPPPSWWTARKGKCPSGSCKIGDVMIVRPGEKIPTDGVILKQESAPWTNPCPPANLCR